MFTSSPSRKRSIRLGDTVRASIGEFTLWRPIDEHLLVGPYLDEFVSPIAELIAATK